MKKHVGKMMPSGSKAVELAIQHVRKPGRWMPVEGVITGKRPDNTLCSDSALNMRVASYIFVVVEVNEIKTADRPIQNHCNQSQQYVHQCNFALPSSRFKQVEGHS